METATPLNYTDHDLLIRIDTRLDGLIKDSKDHETRIRLLEKRQWMFFGGLLVIQALIQVALKVWK